MIRVAIVEDQTLVREGLERLLQITTDICVVARAENGVRALAVLQEQEVDLILLDLRMPEMGGLEFLRRLQGQAAPPVVILTTFDEDDEVLEGIRLGAKGFLMKDVTFATLTETIRQVSQGKTLLQPSITHSTEKRLHQRISIPTEKIPQRLTERENQVLRLIFAGFSNGEIGYALHVSEGTIKNHVSSVLLKLSARDRIHAVLRGIEVGYL